MRRGVARGDPRWSREESNERERARREMDRLAADVIDMREFLETIVYVVARTPIDDAKPIERARRLAKVHEKYLAARSWIARTEYRLDRKAVPRPREP